MSVARLPQMPSTAPRRRLVFTITEIALIWLVVLLGACTRSASRGVYLTPTTESRQAAPEVIIEDVQVAQGEGIYVTGRAALANGECIKTSLLADGKPAAWWPRDVCIEVDANRWEMLASLGRNGAPAQLDPGVAYTVQAWWPKQEQATLAQFPLNLNGPKQP